MIQGASGLRHYLRAVVLAVVYSAIIGLSFYLAYDLRFDFLVPLGYRNQRLHYIGFVIALKLAGLVPARQFESMLSYFGIPDLFRLIWTMTLCSVILLTAHLFNSHLFVLPRGVLMIDYLLCMVGLCTARLSARLYRERLEPSRRLGIQAAQRIAIVGAGDAGAALASEFSNNPGRGFRPVAFFDDDENKHGKQVHGVRVIGSPDKIAEITPRDRISKIVIAMPTATARRIREVVKIAQDAGLKVETLPSLEELASGRMRASRIRPVEVQDLLGRDAVNLDSGAIRKMVEGRVVMVTGAGGSIGSELCRQIAALNPKRLLMVEQAEGNLFTTEQEINELGLGAIALPLVADIADRDRMESIFTRFAPEVVFHAAAHKHVYMMERQPAEAIANNVLGTRRLALIAARHRVAAFVLISTDKAINPTSVMGATKRLAEIQVLSIHAAQTGGGTKFMAVRFGNVLGSSGSVIPIFKRQIARGGPVTVTHPDITRYFMTIPESVGLVLQSAVMGEGGEIFVLDMGQPVKIAELARQMIELSGYKPGEDIEIKYVGLKPGEKLYEELQHVSEKHHPTAHPRVMRFVSETVFSEQGITELERDLFRLEADELKMALKRMVPEYEPFLE
ncbi:MAG TPA: nucleoside-diphosphate sugar epimerase/dehydratase [Opitutaceae bacterium]|jgi:FlaA1/EpsC-like NDP-sugar epimerase